MVPVLDERACGEWCRLPYPGHPRGCPNYGKKDGCPPDARSLSDLLVGGGPVWAVWNRFDLAAHAARMLERHSGWSRRQARCVLYWQPGARKQLRVRIQDWLGRFRLGGPWQLVGNPEAAGVDVSATMKQVGLHLLWPPERYAYQIVLVGRPAITGGS